MQASPAIVLLLVSVRLAAIRLLIIAVWRRGRSLLLLLLCLTIVSATAVVALPASALSGCRQDNDCHKSGDGELLITFHVRSLLVRYRTVIVRCSVERIKRVKIIQYFRVLV